MTAQGYKIIRTLWRVAAGILAVLALGLTAIRVYYLSRLGPPEGSNDLVLMLGLIFPLSLGLIFGYLAIVGKIPDRKQK